MTQAPARILVVDDETTIRTTLAEILRRRGHDVAAAATGAEAMGLIHERDFDLLLLDLRLPDLSGIDIAERAHDLLPDAAVIIVTGHGSLESAVESIHLRVYDYMLKTSSSHDVVARVTTALEQQRVTRRQQQLARTLQAASAELVGGSRREAVLAENSERWLKIGDLQLSSWRQMVQRSGETLPLTPTEFRVLQSLAEQVGHVMTYQQIVRAAQNYDADAHEAAELIKPHIYHLRQKLERDPSNPRYILTVRGTGYMLVAHQRDAE